MENKDPGQTELISNDVQPHYRFCHVVAHMHFQVDCNRRVFVLFYQPKDMIHDMK